MTTSVDSTAAPAEQGRGFPLYRPGVADLVFLFVAAVALRGAAQGLLDDPGLGWHLRNIDAITQQIAELTVAQAQAFDKTQHQPQIDRLKLQLYLFQNGTDFGITGICQSIFALEKQKCS